ncbi:TPA: fatty acid--CoA ligase family protein [Campylobacter coli]|nr:MULTISPECIES: fatty acid--CoA ligase family protein [Campylobacter]AGZ21799.1 AMP-binding protein [Campylobacter coli 15-537360]EAI4878536.1 long-chain fatty acid--CoA ligase [Campylobacter coli]EAI4883305.1 long-chain fatty acid--CoA ligase [Campylobacter jejuni]EAJ7836035.1 long-chain fatty acid--CoA ligase [Campylobacter jejuni]EAK1162453.1 long-chain fatty acid--CoA ligase [Campylobacter jejuni]
MDNFSDKFVDRLEKYDQHIPAIIDNDKVYSYDELNLLKKKYILKLQEKASKYDTIAIIGDYSINAISFLLACIKTRMNVVPIIKDVHYMEKIKESGARWIFESDDFFEFDNDVKYEIVSRINASDDSAMVLFSSGSTGKPKAIVHSLNMLLKSYMEKKIRSINMLLFLMFDHIGGINTLFNVLATGSCGIIVEERKNMKSIASAIEKYKISILPASPSFLNLFLISGVYLKYDLSSLKFITYGTEKMPDALLEKLRKVFSNVRFHQTFGTSEVGITQTSTYNDFIRLENVDYKIVNNELYIKSKTQSLGYLNSDNSSFRNDGYFATGDLVETCMHQGKEYIKIIGRNKEMINVGGEKVLPSEVEEVILKLPYIKDCLVFGENNAITGQSVSLKVVLDLKELGVEKISNTELKKKIRSYCKDKLALYKIPSKVEIVEYLEISDRFKKIRNKNR